MTHYILKALIELIVLITFFCLVKKINTKLIFFKEDIENTNKKVNELYHYTFGEPSFQDKFKIEEKRIAFQEAMAQHQQFAQLTKQKGKKPKAERLLPENLNKKKTTKKSK